MLERRVDIINSLGLHARAAAHVVRLACTFRSKITLERCDTGLAANAKSILSVLHLAAGYDVSLRIIVEGEDELAAVEALEDLFLGGFGEI